MPTAQATRALEAVRRYIGRWGLIIALLIMPVAFGIHDLTSGYQNGFVHGHAVINHDLSRLGQNMFEGVSDGAIWALIAIGYTLVYGIIELINFAHGDVFMIGSFVGAGFWGSIGLGLSTGLLGLVLGLLLTLIVCMVVCGSLNVLIERVAYRPLRAAPKLAPLITAVGFSFILQNVGLLWLGGSQQSVNDLIGSANTLFHISGITISRGYVLAIGVMIPLVFALAWFINGTRAGKAMRATAQDPEAARLMGINVDWTISLTFLIGGALAGAAGLVYALYETTIWYLQGFEAGLIAFTAAVMGGI
ncbi:MAG TPA: branched-chain amino acid ABC transporter permease, partial [Solirubrobacteraceae bacterium]|nr:branched-chain amino acid ABC transporter permease [Solirubrobacteraceae bacterium]